MGGRWEGKGWSAECGAWSVEYVQIPWFRPTSRTEYHRPHDADRGSNFLQYQR